MAKDERTKTAEDPKDALIATLSDRLAKLEARLGPDEAAAAVAPKTDWPRTLFMRGHQKGQIDHPGVLTKVVRDQATLDAAVDDGWSTTPLESLDHEDAHALVVPTSKAKKKTAKKAA